MKNRPLLLLLFTIVLFPPSAFSQGNLAPPGAPAPTMKSLDQIEARTPISSVPFTISQSGSYYLTKNLNVTGGDAVTIAANQVTLDLNGFTISSTAPSATGTAVVLTSGRYDITILNGHIKGGVTYSGGVYSGSGFANGIEYFGTPPLNVRVCGVSVSGCLSDGIYLASNASIIVESCSVQTVGGDGIVGGSILRSVASQCGNLGILGTTVSDSYGQTTGSGYGIAATNVSNCRGSCSGSGQGISATTATNCYGDAAGGIGLTAQSAADCWGQSDGSVGIYTLIANGCYGKSNANYGLSAVYTATNCFGETSSTSAAISSNIANNCYGRATGSGSGISCYIAHNSVGMSNSGVGMSVTYAAIGCHASSTSNTALIAFIANSCSAQGPSVINYKYNMP